MELILGIAFLISRFGFGVLMFGVGVASIFYGANDYLLLGTVKWRDVRNLLVSFLIGIPFLLIGILAMLSCATLDISL